MHLLPTYAFASGLRIDRMMLPQHPYPLGTDAPFMVVVAATGMEGKNYPYWNIVLNALRKPLRNAGIKIVQAGTVKDQDLRADIDLRSKTNTPQYMDIISRAALVLCGDTSAVHAAGHFDRSLVTLFSVSHPDVSGAYYGSKERQIYLTPPNWTPSYNPNENPKTIGNIVPERVVAAVGRLLNVSVPVFETVSLGIDVNLPLVEMVPDMILRPDYRPGTPVNMRFDKGGQEERVYEQLSIRKGTVVTTRPLNIRYLEAVQDNVEMVIYVVTENDEPAFPQALQRSGLPYCMVTFMPENQIIPKLLSYTDLSLIHRKTLPTKETVKKFAELKEGARFSSPKQIISGGKAFLSFAHWEAGKPLDSIDINDDTIIDSPSFWEDSSFYHIYNP